MVSIEVKSFCGDSTMEIFLRLLYIVRNAACSHVYLSIYASRKFSTKILIGRDEYNSGT